MDEALGAPDLLQNSYEIVRILNSNDPFRSSFWAALPHGLCGPAICEASLQKARLYRSRPGSSRQVGMGLLGG